MCKDFGLLHARNVSLQGHGWQLYIVCIVLKAESEDGVIDGDHGASAR